jgi:hypothetical protein
MLTNLKWGTYVFFGILTYLGAAFIWFFVPETSRLTLEEMDTVFGSVGTAQADYERMATVKREIGLDALLGVVEPAEKTGQVYHKDNGGDGEQTQKLQTFKGSQVQK